eukprot:TRINITY_DN24534_c0_g1_i2.p1 TRINITY_DN24534_c0_g1~~TRINITY_DN24534_c0_g1_i2.p1  ORF type:complete len:390 (-),score=47.94 TRINITY_DN24534_c0_g1_i2:154-1323(-)
MAADPCFFQKAKTEQERRTQVRQSRASFHRDKFDEHHKSHAELEEQIETGQMAHEQLVAMLRDFETKHHQLALSCNAQHASLQQMELGLTEVNRAATHNSREIEMLELRGLSSILDSLRAFTNGEPHRVAILLSELSEKANRLSEQSRDWQLILEKLTALQNNSLTQHEEVVSLKLQHQHDMQLIDTRLCNLAPLESKIAEIQHQFALLQQLTAEIQRTVFECVASRKQYSPVAVPAATPTALLPGPVAVVPRAPPRSPSPSEGSYGSSPAHSTSGSTRTRDTEVAGVFERASPLARPEVALERPAARHPTPTRHPLASSLPAFQQWRDTGILSRMQKKEPAAETPTTVVLTRAPAKQDRRDPPLAMPNKPNALPIWGNPQSPAKKVHR